MYLDLKKGGQFLINETAALKNKMLLYTNRVNDGHVVNFSDWLMYS